MKRCPECRRDYTDETLNFCLDDGTALLDGPGSVDEPATAVYPGAHETEEAPTRTFENDGTKAELPSTGRKRTNRGFLVAGVVGIVTLAALSIAAYWFYGRTESRISSIAVMPFSNESGNADIEYLSDGMTETLIGSLSQIPELNIKARSSVFRYKGKDASAQTIGKELGVQAILNGRVVQRGQDLTLYVELVDVQNENSLWKQTYNRAMTNLLTLQTEVARDVAGKLKVKLSGADEQRMARNRTGNSEAYEAYLKGRYFIEKPTEEGYKNALEYFQKAVESDPSYALPYVGIADAYINAADWYLSVNDSMPKAKAAALKALEMDDSLAEAYSTMMYVSLFYDWDWPEVERLYKRTVELNPNYGWGHNGYGVYLEIMGRSSESIAHAQQVLQIDPLSIEANRTLGDAYFFAREYDQAIEHYRKTVSLDPNYWWPHLSLGQAYLHAGRFDEAIAEMEKARSLDNSPLILSQLGAAYALAGKKSRAREMLEELKTLSGKGYVSPEFFALIHANLGDRDAAFEWLERGFADRSIGLLFLKVGPGWDGLRSDTRFQAMMRRVGLPQ